MEEKQRREKQLRNMMQQDKVVVFQREVLRPWDGVPRFDFLDCNLKAAMNDGEEYESKHMLRLDKFIGAINQLKPAPVKKQAKKNVSAFEQQLAEHKEKYRNMMQIGPKKQEKH